MTDLQSPPNYNHPAYGQPNPQFPQQPPMDPAQAAAYAKAAKAHAKSLRPWFKKKRFVVPIALVAICLGAKAMPGGGDTSTPTAAPAAAKPAAKSDASAPKAEAPKAEVAASGPGIGTAVKSGDFKITITKVKSGVKSVGTSILGEKAQGQFVLVSLKATNEGDKSAMLLGDEMKLIDGQGREFSVNSVASIYVSENNPLLEEINPGNTSKGTLVFDLPKGVKPVTAEISAGGLFEDATKVDLTN